MPGRSWLFAVATFACACRQTRVNEGAPAQPYPQETSGSHSPTSISIGVQIASCSTDTAIARIYRDGYGSMVSRTDEQSVAQRVALKIPMLFPDQVVIVTDHSVCSTASAAFDKELGVSAASEAPIVLKLGTQWAVVKHLAFRHIRPNVIFDSTFTTAVARIWY
jgi:hypothetical protein